MKVYLIFGVYNDEYSENFCIISDSDIADSIVSKLKSIYEDSFWKFYSEEFEVDNLNDFDYYKL